MKVPAVFLLVLGCILWGGCSAPTNTFPVNRIGTSAFPVNTALVKPASSNADTLWVKKPAAIFFQPDSLQMLAIRSNMDTTVYKSQVHELFYQMRNARLVMREFYPAISIIETNRHRYISCWIDATHLTVIDLNQLHDISGIILFEGRHPTKVSDMMNIETELGEKFRPIEK
jgi:hypothetical protein